MSIGRRAVLIAVLQHDLFEPRSHRFSRQPLEENGVAEAAIDVLRSLVKRLAAELIGNRSHSGCNPGSFCRRMWLRQ